MRKSTMAYRNKVTNEKIMVTKGINGEYYLEDKTKIQAKKLQQEYKYCPKESNLVKFSGLIVIARASKKRKVYVGENGETRFEWGES